MKTETSNAGRTLQQVGTGAILLLVVAGGILALLYFWNQLLRPGDLNSISLPLVALIAGIASTFNPCSLPAIPGFLAIGAGSDGGVKLGRRVGLSLAVALGALTIVMALGILVAIVGGRIASDGPDVAGFQVPVYDAPAVGELQAPAGLPSYADGLFQAKTVVSGIPDNAFYVAATHQLGDHVGLALVVSQVKHGNDMRMGAKTAHGLGFPGNAGSRDFVQSLRLDEGERHLPVQQGVLGQVHFLFPALT